MVKATMDRLRPTTDRNAAAQDADLIVEAIVEVCALLSRFAPGRSSFVTGTDEADRTRIQCPGNAYN